MPLSFPLHPHRLAILALGLVVATTALHAALPTGDSALWERAAHLARISRWMFPGRAVIDELSTQDRTTTRSHVTANLHRDDRGEPNLSVAEVRIDGKDKTGDLAGETATQLTPLVESLYAPNHPLRDRPARDTVYVGEIAVESSTCRGFRTRAQVDGVTIESTIWIDTARGYARRIDFRALGLPLRRDGATIRELNGSTDYTLDSQGRWLMVRHSEHTALKARFLFSNIDLTSDKTITCDDYWEYRGARRQETDDDDTPAK